MFRNSNFWRIISICLGIFLITSILLNSLSIYKVPQKITLFMLGTLISIGIGNSIMNPRTSIIRLSAKEEKRFQNRQIIVGFVLSSLFCIILIVEELRESPLIWLLFPIIMLPFFLIFYKKKKHE